MKNNCNFLNNSNSCVILNKKNNKIFESNENSEKFNFNLEKIFEKIKEQKNNDTKNNKNEYYCNLLKNCLDLTPLTKMEYLELLLYYNISSEDKNYKYYIFKKISKNLNLIRKSINEKEMSKYNEILIKQILFLEEENNYFYSYHILSEDIIYTNQSEIKKIKKQIEEELLSFVSNKRKIFEKLEKNDFIKYKDILTRTRKNKNNYDGNEILYAINNLWINKAIKFFDDIIYLIDNDGKNNYKQIFDLYEIYYTYFHKNQKKINFFPGLIDNYNIIDYKDIWKDNNNDKEDENYLIKKDLVLGKDYSFVNETEWKELKELFGATNEIKKKMNNLELFDIKAIIFDKRIIKYNKLNLLRYKHIIIGKNNNIKNLKEKIIRTLNYIFENQSNQIIKNRNINETNNSNNIIDEKNEYKIHLYKLSKKNKQLLVEILTSFINGIPVYESINIENINLKDDNSLELLFNNYNKKNDILLIEIIPKDSYQFLFQKKKNDKELYQCPTCKKWISLKNRYFCEICHFSLYCSKKCAYSSLNKKHMDLHEYLNEFIIKKFNLNDFLKMELNTSKYNDGLVGLNNLGNTCFINSSLQCLFNTYDLSKYFLSNYFKEEINKKNKLGFRGIIAESYAELLDEVKTTINSIVNPLYFIKQFYKNNKSLNLNVQQDAQEFLSLLLDSLHEDLNRITNKPYIELEEQRENEHDSEASKRWWDCHKKREDSIIIDLFHGQFKSMITCLNCKKTSISYEPYLFLGLPIPQFMKEQKIIKFFFGNKCDYLGITIDEKTTILDLKKKAIESLRMNNYKKELTYDELYGIIEIVQFDNNKIIKNIYDNLHNFDKLSPLIEKEDNLEIVLYEKKPNYLNIYIYPIKGDEYDISSYPIALPVNDKMTFGEIVDNNREKIMSLYTNLHKDDGITIGLMHKINDSWFHYFINGLSSNEKCPICNKTENKFCFISEKDEISRIFNEIKKKNNEYGPPLFVMGNKNKFLVENKNMKSNKIFNNGLSFLSDCLKLFCEEEFLNSDNLWYCNKCKKHQKAKKQIRLYKLPIYLIIQLKKFKNNVGFFSSSNEKKEVYIKYPINDLDLSDYIENIEEKKEKYDLYAVIQHHGKITQGHYTAICKKNDKWYLFNDSKYILINNPVTKDAYLLFYKKK